MVPSDHSAALPPTLVVPLELLESFSSINIIELSIMRLTFLPIITVTMKKIVCVIDTINRNHYWRLCRALWLVWKQFYTHRFMVLRMTLPRDSPSRMLETAFMASFLHPAPCIFFSRFSLLNCFTRLKLDDFKHSVFLVVPMWSVWCLIKISCLIWGKILQIFLSCHSYTPHSAYNEWLFLEGCFFSTHWLMVFQPATLPPKTLMNLTPPL